MAVAAVIVSSCFAAVAAHAATVVRQVQSGGTAQLRAGGSGPDGVQRPELAPTFSRVPDLQEGPRAEDAGADATAARELSSARKRMVNRSIAKARGSGETVVSDERVGADAALRRSFDGLSMRDTRLADGGNSFSVEPPDQGLCVGNGFVVESVNDAIRVYDREGNALTGVTSLNTFYGYPVAINRTAGTFGPALTDPTCYYDPSVRRFFHVILTLETNPATGALTGVNHLDLAVSSTADPRNAWTIYRIPVQDDGTQGTPVHPDCPCLGDYPHIGADANGVYLTTNEFPFSGGFNSAQIYALSKRDLVNGAASLTLVQIDTIDHLLDGNPGFTVWPAVSPKGDFARNNRGTEYFLSSVAVFNDSGTDHRLRVWALGNTQSLDTNSPDVTLTTTAVHVRRYGVPPPATQKPGPTPLAECLNDTTLVTPFGVGCWNVLFDPPQPPHADAPELLDTNDSRMQQVFYTGGRLYGALDTAVRVRGQELAGIAYYSIVPWSFPGSVFALPIVDGKLAVEGNHVSYPAIAAFPSGRGAIAFTLVGPDHYPSAAYVLLGPLGHQGPVRIAAAGKGPDDGFSGYAAFDGGPVARWGDYGAAAIDGDDLWIASEYIGQRCTLAEYANFSAFGSCGGTRVALGNWLTRISRLQP
jgi:hypothetical protein